MYSTFLNREIAAQLIADARNYDNPYLKLSQQDVLSDITGVPEEYVRSLYQNELSYRRQVKIFSARMQKAVNLYNIELSTVPIEEQQKLANNLYAGLSSKTMPGKAAFPYPFIESLFSLLRDTPRGHVIAVSHNNYQLIGDAVMNRVAADLGAKELQKANLIALSNFFFTKPNFETYHQTSALGTLFKDYSPFRESLSVLQDIISLHSLTNYESKGELTVSSETWFKAMKTYYQFADLVDSYTLSMSKAN